MPFAKHLAVITLLSAPPALAAAPAFTPDGGMVMPADYREWVFLSSGLDMSYDQAAMKTNHSMFNNVFANPDAYRAFLQTGHWLTARCLYSRCAKPAMPSRRFVTANTRRKASWG